VVSLAVAVVVGTAFTALVNSFVKCWITPFIAIIFRGGDFKDLTFQINGSIFAYGEFINVLLTFIIICCVLYFLVVLPMNTLVEAYFPDEPKPKTKKCPFCGSEKIFLKATKCPYCCSEFPPEKVQEEEIKVVVDNIVFNK
jgi:large conductance mechanosensitive channel